MSHNTNEHPDGYRLEPRGGARIRSDIVDVYVFRRMEEKRIEVLQLLRASKPMADVWHPLMAHIEDDERAVECAVREMEEEVGLTGDSKGFVGMWALEQVHPYFLHDIDCIVLSPRFAVEVTDVWTPRLNNEHKTYRWVRVEEAVSFFVWPGQVAAVREIVEHLIHHARAEQAVNLDRFGN